MITMKDIFEVLHIDPVKIDESAFAAISDELWKLGNIRELKEQVDQELFHLHVGINITGIWKSEGWGGILGEQADLVPFIPETLDQLNLPEIREALESVVELFPEDTIFRSDSAEYDDVYNFLGTFNYKPQKETLKKIPPEKRREMVRFMRQKEKILEECTEKYWKEDSEAGGWKHILDFLHEKMG